MKNFFLILGSIFVAIFSMFVSSSGLLDIFSVDVETSNVQKVYASGDLGFTFEKQNTTKSLLYLDGDRVIGECVVLKGNENKVNYVADKLGLTIINRYFFDNKMMIEGVSAILPYRLESSNINVQICFQNDSIIIGSPIIYGNY